MSTDTRIVELEALAQEEGFRLPMAVDLIVYFEQHGYVVDLRTGELCRDIAVELSPTAQALCHLYGMNDDDLDAIFAPVVVDDSQLAFDLFDYAAEAADYEDDMLDREYHARGGW